MLFCSQQFAIFFTLVFAAYWLLPWPRARVYLLLAASLYFYASWNKWLALVLLGSTTLDWLVARGIEAASSDRRKRGLLAVSIVCNLALLCYFKYANFFLHSLSESLRAAGAEIHFPVLSVILPIGISFYTFEAISYCVDVYQGRLRAERNLANLLVFILFFPHLVAGPIVRARDFLPQVSRPKRWNWFQAQAGVELFLLGLVKKLAIADRMALYADPVFAAPDEFKSHAVWLGVLAYVLQIYCDFSGYSDMALGCAHLLGYRLAPNFERPYQALNVSEFWRRWHISLSTWLRDYLFIPLGGSRAGEFQTARNLLITMTLGGLWHGASWTFIVWGLLHGVLLVAHRQFRAWCELRPAMKDRLQTVPGTMLRWALTMAAVSVGWVFFRSETFQTAATVLQRMVVPCSGRGLPLNALPVILSLVAVIVAHLMANGGGVRWVQRLPAPVAGAVYGVGLSLTLLLAAPANQAFIYFQF